MLITLSVATKELQASHGAPPASSFTPAAEVTSMATVPAPVLPPPPPPPPPPPLPTSASLSRRDSASRSRLRNLNWERIPRERVEGRRSLWSGAASVEDLTIDLRSLDELFGHKARPLGRAPSVRRSLVRSGSLQESAADKQVALLDAKRSMNVGIFLRQFKSAPGEIVEDIRRGAGERYGAEKLSELCKLLPDGEEEKKLRLFQGDRRSLVEPDLFMVLLVEVPSFRLRLDAMILQQEFDPAVTSLCVAARCLGEAARELLNCQELHSILHLVLKAGNYMNAGGYAGNAAGFRIASLLKLADTKANKPGMNLLHFVAMEAVKKNPSLLSFSSQLSHVGPASRQSEESVKEDLSLLRSRVEAMRANIQTEPEIQQQMQSFLESAEGRLGDVGAEVEALRKASQALVEFFLEDETTFKLEEACRIFYSFCHRFQRAVQENAERELQEQRRAERQRESAEKRRSIAACTGLGPGPGEGQDDLERTLEKSLSYTWHRRSLRPPEARRSSYQCGLAERPNADAPLGLLGPGAETAGVKRELNGDAVHGLNGDAAHRRQGANADSLESRRSLKTDTIETRQGVNAGTIESRQGLNVNTIDSKQNTDTVHRRQDLSTETAQSQQRLINVAFPGSLNPITDTTPSQQDPPSDHKLRIQGRSAEELPANAEREKGERPANAASCNASHRACGAAPLPSESMSATVATGDDLRPDTPSSESARLLRLVSERVLRQQQTLGGASLAEARLQPESRAGEPGSPPAQDADSASDRGYPRMGETLECHTLVRGLRSYDGMTASPLPRPAPSHCSKWKKEREADERDGARSPQSKDDARNGKDPARGPRKGLMARAGPPSNSGIPRVRSKTESTAADEGPPKRTSRAPPPRSASARSAAPVRPVPVQSEPRRAASAREKGRVVAEQAGKPGRGVPERTKAEKDKAEAAPGAFVRGSPLRVPKRLAPNSESQTPASPRTVQNPSSNTAKTIRKAVITAAAVKTAKTPETSKLKAPGTRLPGPKVSRPSTQPPSASTSQPMWR